MSALPLAEDVAGIAAVRHWAPTLPFEGVELGAYPALNALVALDTETARICNALRLTRDVKLAAASLVARDGGREDSSIARIVDCLAVWQEEGLLADPPSTDAASGGGDLSVQHWAHEGVYAPFGPRVRLRIEDASLAPALPDQLSPARVAGSAHEHRVDLVGQACGFLIVEDGVARPPIGDPVQARGATINALLRIGPLKARWQALLHAACLSRGSDTVVLSAPWGAGKSTLSAALLHEGWQLISDDVVPLAVESLEAYPVPLKPSIKSGSWDELSGRFAELQVADSHWLGRRVVRYVDLSSTAFAVGSRRPSLVVFTRFAPGARPSIVRVEPLQALCRLTSDLGWIDLEPSRLGHLLRWLSFTPAYAITYPDTASALSLLDELLAERPSRERLQVVAEAQSSAMSL